MSHKQVPIGIFHCRNCDLIFKDPQSYLNWDDQRDRYDLHENNIENPGYVEFFEQLMKPLRPFLKSSQSALDWGSGPGESPVLAQLLGREGLKVDIYDPIYQPVVPSGHYDVITSTEVVEHFQNPRGSFREILSHMRPGGVFAGLTQFHSGPGMFSNWWYVKDPTHVVFYSERTLQWVAGEFGLEVLYLQHPVFVFRKR